MKETKDNLNVEFSVRFLINRFSDLFSFLNVNKNHIILSSISILFFTISYNYLIKPKYYAQTSFVLDNDNSKGMGELSSVASLAGINPSSFIDASSLFQIDNIQDLYRSDAMLKKTLLSYGDFNDGKRLIINKLGKIQNKSNKWKANKIVFDKENNLNREQDSVI